MPFIRCPRCSGQFNTELSPAMPFCSVRCRQLDLADWLDERHKISVATDNEDEEEGSEDS